MTLTWKNGRKLSDKLEREQVEQLVVVNPCYNEDKWCNKLEEHTKIGNKPKMFNETGHYKL